MDFNGFKNFWVDPTQQDITLTTSGSTGEPCPVALPKKGLKWSAQNTNNVLKITEIPNCKLLCCIPTHKIGGLMMWVRALELGVPIETIEPSADPMLALMPNHNFNVVSLVPYQLEQILQNHISVAKLNRFKLILLGGASLNTLIIQKIQNLKAEVYLTYGMTETFSHIALQKLNGLNKQSHFELMPDCLIKTNSQNNLLIKTPFTNNQYLLTHDRVELLSSKTFQFIGRSDFVINSGGIKLFPEEIELAIAKLEVIGEETEWLVSALPHVSLGEQVVFVSNKPVEPALQVYIQKQVPPYFKPKVFVTLGPIPRTETGKINRKQVKELILLHTN